MNYDAAISLEIGGLEIGHNVRIVCPACQGGTSSEKSLSVTLSDSGSLMYQCFRAQCLLKKGSGTSRPILHSIKSVKVRKVFEGKVCPLSEGYTKWIAEHWGITDPPYWWYTHEYGGRIAMSVRSPKYMHRGWVLRDITGRAHTKALTYINDREEGLSWYKVDKLAPTVVVEDCPSAVRASMQGVNAVALLGTSVGANRAEEIAQNASAGIIIALDQDATGMAIRMKQRYNLLWDNPRVLPLPKDIKDMNIIEVQQLLEGEIRA